MGIFFCISNFLRVSAYVHSDLFAHRNCTPVPMYALETMHKRLVHIFVPPLRCKKVQIVLNFPDTGGDTPLLQGLLVVSVFNGFDYLILLNSCKSYFNTS